VSAEANDKKELPHTVAAICPVVAPQVKTILIDSGFYNDAAKIRFPGRTHGYA